VVTEFGVERYRAPKTFVSMPGTKRALVTLQDTIWTTYHVTDKTDLVQIEEEIIAKDYAEYDELAFQRNLSQAIGSVDAPITIRTEES
jgi:predicted PolB exonuclease-like 3'-5' exonuclease